MNDAVDSFLSSRLPIVGLAAYSVQSPNRVLAAQCLGEAISPAAAERMTKGLVRLGRTYLPAGERAARYCWTFEGFVVHIAARADGKYLALIVEHKPGVQTTRVEEMLQGFLELTEL